MDIYRKKKNMESVEVNWGNSYYLGLTITDSSGTPINLTDKTVKFTVKKIGYMNKTDDEDAVITKTITTHISPTEGYTAVLLTPDDTKINEGVYYADLKVVELNKNTSPFKLVITPVITRS